MNKLCFKIVLIAIVILYVSCEEKIDLDIPDQTPKMVAYGVLSPGESPVLDIRRSYTIADRNIDKDMYYQQVNAVNLSLYKNNQLLGNFTSSFTDAYSFYLNYNNFIEGEKYILRGSAPNYPDIYAETVIPSKPDAFVSNFQYAKLNDYDYKFSLNININDNPLQENYYCLSFTSHSSFFPIQYANFEDINTEHPDPSVVRQNYEFYINDKLFNGKLKSILLDGLSYRVIPWGFKGNQNFWLECKAITKDYYDYKISIFNQGKVDFDFFAEPVLIKNNIKGGFGILGSSNKKEYLLTIQTK